MSFINSASFNAFDPVTLKRGKEYFLSGKVSIITCTPSRITAFVKGNERYKVNITLDKSGKMIKASCTCPCTFACKHIAATLLEVNNERDEHSSYFEQSNAFTDFLYSSAFLVVPISEESIAKGAQTFLKQHENETETNHVIALTNAAVYKFSSIQDESAAAFEKIIRKIIQGYSFSSLHKTSLITNALQSPTIIGNVFFAYVLLTQTETKQEAFAYLSSWLKDKHDTLNGFASLLFNDKRIPHDVTFDPEVYKLFATHKGLPYEVRSLIAKELYTENDWTSLRNFLFFSGSMLPVNDLITYQKLALSKDDKQIALIIGTWLFYKIPSLDSFLNFYYPFASEEERKEKMNDFMDYATKGRFAGAFDILSSSSTLSLTEVAHLTFSSMYSLRNVIQARYKGDFLGLANQKMEHLFDGGSRPYDEIISALRLFHYLSLDSFKKWLSSYQIQESLNNPLFRPSLLSLLNNLGELKCLNLYVYEE
jgi:hypothetical protein